MQREKKLPDLLHDTEYHAAMLDLRHNRESICAVSGLSQHTLKKMRVRLSVDRLDNGLGYVPGNCCLLAEPLNTAKGCGTYVPRLSLERLLKRADRYVRSVHDRT